MRPNQSAISLRQDDSCSLNHLVGASEHYRWHSQAKLLRSCQVDDQLELGCLLDRQIARFRTIEDSNDITGGQTEQGAKVGAVRYQSAKLDEVTRLVHGW